MEELIFLVHQLYREYQLTSRRRDIIGYLSSLNFRSAYPAVYLRREIAYIASNYLDRRYTLSLAQDPARERMTRVLEDEYLGILFDGELSGAAAYVVMITLASACGARFEAFVYRTCLQILVQEIGQNEISQEWSPAQTSSLIKVTSCLLDPSESAQEYEASIEEFFSSNKADNGYSVAAICLGNLNHYLGETS